ncbi:hypothetical protein, partial [Corallococcus carmarthensis]|uniref:hypothetical protein n=1 Tax=Corallococcus carmarthensis TaxID=2316728 RepID=UPI001C0F9522
SRTALGLGIELALSALFPRDAAGWFDHSATSSLNPPELRCQCRLALKGLGRGFDCWKEPHCASVRDGSVPPREVMHHCFNL